jgi:hypothetical protein
MNHSSTLNSRKIAAQIFDRPTTFGEKYRDSVKDEKGRFVRI